MTHSLYGHTYQALEEFLTHLNSFNSNIKFLMEVKKHGTLLFLDQQIFRKPDDKLGYVVYRKLMHTDVYLNASSFHHPAQIHSVLSMLVHRVSNGNDPPEGNL